MVFCIRISRYLSPILLPSGLINNSSPCTCRVIGQWFTSAADAGLPQKPKKPLGQFFLFSMDRFQQVKAENPDLHVPQIAKMVAGMWRQLNDKEKEMYKLKAQQSMEEHKEAMAIFRARLTDDDLEMIASERRQIEIIKAQRRHKQELKKLEKPKRPLTAYAIFLQSQLKNTQGSGTHKMASVSKEWKEMIEEDKLTYKDVAAQSKQDYIVAMEEWEAKMAEQGHLSLLRKKSQHRKL